MGTITFVRHGQANSQATDEAGYDRLSELGRRQAAWLGDWLRNQGETFDSVTSGSLIRHRDTARAMGFADPVIDPRLNEMDYFNLGRALHDARGIPMPGGDGFAEHVPVVMEAWHAAEIQGDESFTAFESRIAQVLAAAVQPGRNILCITSGGVIGMVLRRLLDLDPRRFAMVLLPIHNTSLHRVHVTPAGPILAQFNATPHLDQVSRHFARTHY